MEKIYTALGNTLFHALDQLRQDKGKVSVEDAGAMLENLLETAFEKKPVYQQMAQIVKDIEDAKNEIKSLSSNKHSNEKALSEASEHLSTVIQSTEQATLSLLNEAENIRNLAAGIGGQKEDDINAACMRICELCSFQDLAGQRITKVIVLINVLERHIINLIKLFGVSSKTVSGSAADEHLLNGPQLPKDAINQEDVDAILKSLGM